MASDCQSDRCLGGTCVDGLVISQIQTRGTNGGNDEFVEIYNPGTVPVTFDSTWTLKERNATAGLSGCASAGYGTRVTGGGQVIPPHGHILFVNAASPGYSELTAPDGTYPTSYGIPDASSVVLFHGASVVDALCFYYDATTEATLTGCSVPYTCSGTPVLNPHDNTSSTDVDASLERKPGGSGGNTVNTGNNANDFATNASPDPHDLASTPVP